MNKYTNPKERHICAGEALQRHLHVAMKGPWTADFPGEDDVWDGPLVLGPEFNNQGEKDNPVIAQALGIGSQANAAYIALMHPGNGEVLAKALIRIGKNWLVTWEVFDDGSAWCCDDCDGMLDNPYQPCACPGSLLLPFADSILERLDLAYDSP